MQDTFIQSLLRNDPFSDTSAQSSVLSRNLTNKNITSNNLTQDTFTNSSLSKENFPNSIKHDNFTINNLTNDTFKNIIFNTPSLKASSSFKAADKINTNDKFCENNFTFAESGIKACSTPFNNNKKRVFVYSENTNLNNSFSPVSNKKIKENLSNSNSLNSLNDVSCDLFL